MLQPMLRDSSAEPGFLAAIVGDMLVQLCIETTGRLAAILGFFDEAVEAVETVDMRGIWRGKLVSMTVRTMQRNQDSGRSIMRSGFCE